MTESTQAPEVGTPMDTNNSNNNDTENSAGAEKNTGTSPTAAGASQVTTNDTGVTKDGTNSKTDDKGIKDSKQDTDAKCDEPEVKRKDKFDTKTGDQARGKDGDDKSLDEKENGTEPSSVTGSNESTEDNKTGGDEKDAGVGDNVEKMDVDQKEEPVATEKKRLIRESPCGNDCSNGCNGKFTEDQRIRVYDIYWALASGSEEQQKWMERHCIDKAIPKVSSKSMASTRNRTFVYLYFLPQPDDNMQKIRVCKKFLAATLGITERILSGFVYRFVGSAGLDLDDGEWSPAAGYEGCSREQIFLLREFIQGLPALPVHYCRNEQCTRKLYELPASIPDVSTLYGMYSSAEESLQREPVEESVFRAVLHQDYNLGFSSNARGDVCNVREYRKAKK